MKHLKLLVWPGQDSLGASKVWSSLLGNCAPKTLVINLKRNLLRFASKNEDCLLASNPLLIRTKDSVPSELNRHVSWKYPTLWQCDNSVEIRSYSQWLTLSSSADFSITPNRNTTKLINFLHNSIYAAATPYHRPQTHPPLSHLPILISIRSRPGSQYAFSHSDQQPSYQMMELFSVIAVSEIPQVSWESGAERWLHHHPCFHWIWRTNASRHS